MGRALIASPSMRSLADRAKCSGMRVAAFADIDGAAVIAEDHRELVDQVVLEQVRRRDRGAVDAGRVQVAVGQSRIGLAVAARGDLHFGVEGPDAAARHDAFAEADQVLADEGGVAVIEFGHVGPGVVRAGEGLLRRGRGRKDVHSDLVAVPAGKRGVALVS